MPDQHSAYLSSQLAAGTSLLSWYPLMARCIHVEFNFTKPNSHDLFNTYFSKWSNNYRGIGAFAAGQLFYPLIHIGTSKLARGLANNDQSQQIQFKHSLVAATVVGAASPVLFNPLKAMVVSMQTRMSVKRFWQRATLIAKQDRFAGFYRGSSFFIIRNATYCPCLLSLSNWLTETSKASSSSPLVTATSTLVSAVVATTVSMPMDVCSTMALTDPKRQVYKSNIDILYAAWKKRGFSGFFAGYKYRLLATGVEIFVYNHAKTFYSNQLSGHKL